MLGGAPLGPLAQLAEQWTFNPLVVGSSPTRSTTRRARGTPPEPHGSVRSRFGGAGRCFVSGAPAGGPRGAPAGRGVPPGSGGGVPPRGRVECSSEAPGRGVAPKGRRRARWTAGPRRPPGPVILTSSSSRRPLVDGVEGGRGHGDGVGGRERTGFAGAAPGRADRVARPRLDGPGVEEAEPLRRGADADTPSPPPRGADQLVTVARDADDDTTYRNAVRSRGTPGRRLTWWGPAGLRAPVARPRRSDHGRRDGVHLCGADGGGGFWPMVGGGLSRGARLRTVPD